MKRLVKQQAAWFLFLACLLAFFFPCPVQGDSWLIEGKSGTIPVLDAQLNPTQWLDANQVFLESPAGSATVYIKAIPGTYAGGGRLYLRYQLPVTAESVNLLWDCRIDRSDLLQPDDRRIFLGGFGGYLEMAVSFWVGTPTGWRNPYDSAPVKDDPSEIQLAGFDVRSSKLGGVKITEMAVPFAWLGITPTQTQYGIAFTMNLVSNGLRSSPSWPPQEASQSSFTSPVHWGALALSAEICSALAGQQNTDSPSLPAQTATEITFPLWAILLLTAFGVFLFVVFLIRRRRSSQPGKSRGNEANSMLVYITRRMLQMIPILILISFLVFIFIRLFGPDPTSYLIMQNPNVKPEAIQTEQIRLGLRDAEGNPMPLLLSYGYWLKSVFQGEFGWSSLYPNRTALEVVFLFLPNSLLLMAAALLISLGISFPIGIYSARRQYSKFDYTFTTLSFLGMSVPIFWLAMLAIILLHLLPSRLFGFWFFPAGDIVSFGKPYEGTFLDRTWHLALPALVLSITNIAIWTRYLRSSLLEVIHSDYIRTARAKGLAENRVINKHALRNALNPMVTIILLSVPYLFTGTIVVEQVFAYPGLGRCFLRALSNLDFSVVQASVILFTVIMVIFNLIADLLYPILDPRIRYTSGGPGD